MSKKLRLNGVRNIPLLENIDVKPDVDYLLALVVNRISVEKQDSHSDDDPSEIYKMKVSHPEFFKEIGKSEDIKIQKGYTKSQILRFSLKDMFKRAGLEDNEESYDKHMNKLIEIINKKYID